MNGADRSHVLMIDPAMESRFQFVPEETETVPTGKGGTGRRQRIKTLNLLPFGSGYDFDKAAGTGTITGGKYTYNVCRVMHKGTWHYGKLREDEPHCMFAGNATGLGVTTGFDVLVFK